MNARGILIGLGSFALTGCVSLPQADALVTPFGFIVVAQFSPVEVVGDARIASQPAPFVRDSASDAIPSTALAAAN